MFEAAKRYLKSIEGSVWCTERFMLIEAMITAIEKSEAMFCTHPEAHIFEPGTLRLELLRKPGYLGCEAYNWLAQHGGIEGQYAMSTILMEHDERVRTIALRMQRG